MITKEFVDEMKRISWDFEEGLIEVLAIENRDMMDIDGIKIKLIAGSPTHVPYWVAEILADEKLATFDMDNSVDRRKLNEIAHRESKEHPLVEINSPLFIRRVLAEIESLREQGTMLSMRKLSAIQGSFNKIMRHRMRKILMYAQSRDAGEQEGKIRKTLSAEEDWLFNKLHDLLTMWPQLLGLPAFDDLDEI